MGEQSPKPLSMNGAPWLIVGVMGQSNRTKPAAQLTGHHAPRTELNIVTDGAVVAPPVPAEVQTEMAKAQWADMFAGPIARYWATHGEMGGLIRYILTFDAWVKARAIVTKAPMIKGSQDRLRVNPLDLMVVRLEQTLGKLETRYGLTPKDRIGLGLDITAGMLAGAELERELDAGADELERSLDIDDDLIIEG